MNLISSIHDGSIDVVAFETNKEQTFKRSEVLKDLSPKTEKFSRQYSKRFLFQVTQVSIYLGNLKPGYNLLSLHKQQS
jgi:hypothetical protein